jgi:alkyldihydroxyacetonephosphate synthase
MKWWGWGVEGVTFTHENKPNFAPFVLDKVGLDLWTEGTPPPDFAEISVPASRLPGVLATGLASAVGEGNVVIDDHDRVVHTYGKGISDLVKVRAGDLPRVPDVVVYPADEDQVREVVDLAAAADAVIIPFGGGSNISGSLTPPADEERPIVSLDMGRMNKVLEIDEDSGLARVQAGVLGPDLEEQLGALGWTAGHQPDSFRHSTLGGWIATRSSGMQSDRYGDIADITRGLRSVLPGKVVTIRPLPSTSTGPSVREMIIGSEGRLGVVTEAWIHVHRVPEKRLVVAYLFQNWGSALEAMRAISTSDVHPSITRVSDPYETQFSLATQKAQTGIKGKISTGIFDLLAKRGWDLNEVCLSYVGYVGSPRHVSYQRKAVGKIVSAHGGIGLGTGPGALYDQKKFDTPYIRDFLLDRGALADVSETAAPWSKLRGIYERVIAGAHRVYDEIGVKGYIMCHLSHSYHAGACLYFTFAFPPLEGEGAEAPLDQYWRLKEVVQQSFIDGGGTLSHHHGVGTDHAPWMEQDISTAGLDLMVGLLSSADPGRNLNPGSLIPTEREW